MQPKGRILSISNKILQVLLPANTCLIRSLVNSKVLALFGYTNNKVQLGVKKLGDELHAHAWIEGFEPNYTKVFELK